MAVLGLAGGVLSNFKTNDFVTTSALSPFEARRRYPHHAGRDGAVLETLERACRPVAYAVTMLMGVPSCQASLGHRIVYLVFILFYRESRVCLVRT